MAKASNKRVEIYIAVSSVLISLAALMVTLVWNFRQEKLIQDLSYQNSAITYRPRLELVERPSINGYESIPVKDTIHIVLENSQQSIKGLTILFDLRFVNRGNDIAHVSSYVRCNNPFLTDDLRRILLTRQTTDEKLLTGSFNSIEIVPNDTLVFPIEYSVSIPSEFEMQLLGKNEATFHYLITYKNSLGVLYDTYFFGVLALDAFIDGRSNKTSADSNKATIFEGNLDDLTLFVEGTVSRYVYSKTESKRAHEFLEDLEYEAYIKEIDQFEQECCIISSEEDSIFRQIQIDTSLMRFKVYE